MVHWTWRKNSAARMSGALWTFVIVLLAAQCYITVQQGLSDSERICLGCICETVSSCNVTSGCDGSVCGPFRITRDYWLDGGQATVNNEPSSNIGAYERCANNIECATVTVTAYMVRYRQDCNGDGVINCEDYMHIHRHGGFACNSRLEQNFENIFRSCMQRFG